MDMSLTLSRYEQEMVICLRDLFAGFVCGPSLFRVGLTVPVAAGRLQPGQSNGKAPCTDAHRRNFYLVARDRGRGRKPHPLNAYADAVRV